ncbi:LacI family DNA-binding transcriptional regulator [Neobacillus sp. PS3-34]|uniref:LacI family DNA-binding transcriptional regulator n=1 Tax=Neobacillus sp. PS3-34 TaxID=3070678 RepID=UPI0027E0310C|nr:LacI family DNA-binding transcriptional regulator [Neobacillus sp. PS3-34]WML49185.1 LacI family DNA-binding transcriptional regulator [Neobacillus sp. PS3-34]
MKRTTMADVAHEAGVSKSTVSQYLNKRYEYMGEETKEKVRVAIEKLGYQPNSIARSLKQKRTSLIGIIVGNIMHGISTEVCRAIEDYCQERGMHAIVCNSYDDGDKEKNYIEMLRARQVDGLIIFPTGENVELYKQMEKENFPIVFVDRKVDGVNVNTIVVDNREATYLAVDHLISNGHQEIAMVTPPLTIYPRIERVKGYQESLKDHGISFSEKNLISAKIAEIVGELEALFTKNNPPTALVAGNDLSFLEVMKFMKKNGIRAGVDLAVVVFDNISFANISTPTITTIAQPAYEMGIKAAELMYKHIKKDSFEPKIYTLKTELIIRESSEGAFS